MSYILDALRRADAERERDPARGIHAQPAPLPLETRRAGRPWMLAGTAVAAALAAAWLLWPRPQPAAVVATPVPVPVVTAPVVAAPTPPAPSTPPPAPRAVAVPVAASVSPPAPPPLPAPQPIAAREARPPVPAVAPVAVPKPAAAVAPVPLAKAPAAAAPASAPERVLAFTELPPEVQRELPKLQISGGVYSDNAAQRMLIVGGQVVTEGAELAPGVVLEQIRSRAAILKFRTWRYSVSY
jgi:general secretion pathway protein B